MSNTAQTAVHTALDAQIALALPDCVKVMTDLLPNSTETLTDVDVMRAWEADFTLFLHISALSESIARDALLITPNYNNIVQSEIDLTTQPDTRKDTDNDHVNSTSNPLTVRTSLLESARNIQYQIQSTLELRFASCYNTTPTKSTTSPPSPSTSSSHSSSITPPTLSSPKHPRLYRLSERLGFSKSELRAFVFIILTSTGLDGKYKGGELEEYHDNSQLQLCRQFAGMNGNELLHFMSPSKTHFVQGLLEVEDENASMYAESKFRAPREVLKAIYGCALTLDEAMTFGDSALYEVILEEPGSIQQKDESGNNSGSSVQLQPLSEDEKAYDEDDDDAEEEHSSHERSIRPKNGKQDDASNAREQTTDNSAVFELLSELQNEGKNKKNNSDGEEVEKIKEAVELEGDGYKDDMDYLKDGFEVVKEACKLYNFRERSNEEDRWSSTKRPVEALQREAEAKLRKASALFLRRLQLTKESNVFRPRLELLVEKLKLSHFERMVIITLVGAVFSQSIRKTLRSDPSMRHESVTVGKLLRMHCDGNLRKEIESRSYFYRGAKLIQSGILTVDIPYHMATSSDLGDFYCDLDRLVLDFVAGLDTELEEIMESARCYTPKIDMDSVILPQEIKQLAIERAKNFDTFRRLRKEVGFDDIVRYGKGLTLFFHGKSGTGKTLFANALASHLNKKLLVVDFNSLTTSKLSLSDAYRIVFREAKIHGAIVFIDECDELFDSRDSNGRSSVTVALREMETFDGIIILATNRPQDLDEAMHRRIALSFKFEPPDVQLRLAIWKKHIPSNLRLANDVDLEALSLEFQLTGGFIKNAIFQALATAVNRAQRKNNKKNDNDEASMLTPDDVVITMDELRQACRLQARGDLSRTKLIRRVIPDCGLEKLVASKESMQRLKDIVEVEKVRRVVTTKFSISNSRHGDSQSSPRVNCVLILGPSGCGKSFAASCLGYETGRPLQRISASELNTFSHEGNQSKTFKSQMVDLFAQAAVAGAVVVIENAEQILFQSSSGLSANALELLFNMQSFDGLVVLCCTTATNTGESGWPAFLAIPEQVVSVLTYSVILSTPNEEQRLQLWRQLLPNDVNVHKDVDPGLRTLSKEYEFNGAQIMASVRRAIGSVAMKHNRESLRSTLDNDNQSSLMETKQNSNVEEKEKEDIKGETTVSTAMSSVEKISTQRQKENGSGYLVHLQDLEEACEAEVKLRKELKGDSIWATSLFV